MTLLCLELRITGQGPCSCFFCRKRVAWESPVVALIAFFLIVLSNHDLPKQADEAFEAEDQSQTGSETGWQRRFTALSFYTPPAQFNITDQPHSVATPASRRQTVDGGKKRQRILIAPVLQGDGQALS